MPTHPRYPNVILISGNCSFIRRKWAPEISTSGIVGTYVWRSSLEALEKVPRVFHSCTIWSGITHSVFFSEVTISDHGVSRFNGTWYCYRFDIDGVTRKTSQDPHNRRANDGMHYLHGNFYLFKLTGGRDKDGFAEYADMSQVLPDDDDAVELLKLVKEKLHTQGVPKFWNNDGHTWW